MLKSFLTNKAVNFLNLHSGIFVLAYNLGGVFTAVFLYQQGIALWQIFLAFAFVFTTRLLCRRVSLKACLRYQLKIPLITGAVLYAVSYLILGQVQTLDAYFYLFFVIFSLSDIFYWLPYHTIFTLLGDQEHRGKQTSIRDGMYRIADFLAPVTSGILVVTYGYWAAFAAASVFMLISLAPLVRIPRLDLSRFEKLETPWKSIEKEGFLLYLGDGFLSGQIQVWRLVLFLLVLNAAYFGGLLGLAVLFQFLLYLFVGHFFDRGQGRRFARVGTFFMIVAVLGRAFLVDSVPEVILFDVFFALGVTLYMPIFNAVFYTLAKESKHSLFFQYYAESGWDIGMGTASLITAGIVFFNPENLRFALPVCLLGFLITWKVLKHYFARSRKSIQSV